MFTFFLRQNLQHCPSYLRELAYKQFVLPILEYCSPVWDPYHQTNINQVEMVQHRAARFVTRQPWRRNNRDSITNILENLQWSTLQEHRKSARLVLLYKVLHDLLIIPNC